MNRDIRSASWRGIFRFVLLPGIFFSVVALIRYSHRPESLSSALGFAALVSLAVTVAIMLVVAALKRLFRPQNRWWLLAGLVCIAVITLLLPSPKHDYYEETSAWLAFLQAIGRAALVVTSVGLLILLVRWLCRRRNLRWSLPAFVALVLSIVGFYVVENWRGKRAWENYKREWESRGEKFDLLSLAPPPVPDDQNFALTPVVASCYRDRLGGKLVDDVDYSSNTNNRLIMTIERSASGAYENYPTNQGNWQRGIMADLPAWQKYYRATSVTNLEFQHSMADILETGESAVPAVLVSSNIVVLPADYPISPTPQTPAADVLLALSKYNAAIEELRKASRLTYGRIPLDYGATNPSEMQFPHLGNFKQVAIVLRLRVIAELQSGQSDLALEDVRLAMRLMDTIQDEPLLISQLVRVAIWQLTLQPIWEGLAEHRWSDAQLVKLEALIARLDFISSYTHAIRGDRALATETIDQWRINREEKDSMTVFLMDAACPTFFRFVDRCLSGDVEDFLRPLIPERFVEYTFLHLPPDGWFYQNNIAVAEGIRRYGMPNFDMETRSVPVGVSTNLTRAAEKWFEDARTPCTVFARMLLPPLTASALKFAHAQASADMARIACALERYHIEHGDYPETLDALAPHFIAHIPHDIIHGEPLKYWRTADGQYVLYSIGWNEVDDGGVVENVSRTRTVNLKKDDWVWWSSANTERLSKATPASE